MPSQDYEEFIAALNERGVRYLVIGAHAVAFHARPRATKDLDILLDPSPVNARRVLAALRDFFGGADLGYTVGDLTDPRWIIQLGVAPVRIDLASQVPGCPSFGAAWGNRVEARFGSVKAYYLGLDDLIRAKEAAGRAQDLADVRILRRAKGRAQLIKRSGRRLGMRG
ncbi:MAG: nucleotidyltransferase [Deltaproteobacteria bacterium]|nr:nucleotidyltransferase [Deltaproteobacteria bacterium]